MPPADAVHDAPQPGSRRRLAGRLVVVAALLATVVWGVVAVGDDAPRVPAADGEVAGADAPETVPGSIGPYDPDEPLDLSGLAGVSDEQVAAAEQLVAEVTASADGWRSVEAAEALGYRSIGDAFTGEEHLVDWSLVGDGVDLDPSRPEALVYDVDDDGERTLVAAMFLRPPGTRADDAPDIGGRLTTWHPHGDLCLDEGAPGDGGGDEPAIAGVTDAAGRCPDGLVELRPMPALHVWLVAHPCGPFAELEGVGVRLDPDVAEACAHRHR